MKIVIVRHGDPDYSIDSLTETGWKEAYQVGERLAKMNIRDFYVSPLGRARDTAKHALELTGKEAEICPWLREFDVPRILRPDFNGERIIAWDWLPQDWAGVPEFYDKDRWMDQEIMKEGQVGPYYREVTGKFDELLARYGYFRNEAGYYTAEQGNNDTICLICHFGVEMALLSHLLNISPMPLWHGFCARPSSVTTIATEERRKGHVLWRMLEFGDTSHLYAAGMEPSFAARFRECYENEDERKD